MVQRSFAALAAAALLAGCSGAGGDSTPSSPTRSTSALHPQAGGANVVVNPGFETGSLSPWTSCGSASAVSVTTAKAHSGSYSALLGSTAKPEVNGSVGVCQTVTVPAGGTLSFWVYEGTDDSISYVDQEADILSTSGSQLTQLYAEAASTNGWEQKTFSLSAYAGQTVQLYFGVKGNGYSRDYVYEYLDDVSLTGAGATATPTAAPTATPTAAPTSSATPTAKPTSSAAPTPTPAPTATASSTPYACNNQQFLTDQTEFGNGTISSDQLVDICGAVTKVLPAQTTSSGTHGYFYAEMPSGYQIEIVSNLNAMADAPSDDPPAWPWVAVNQYVYVQGRYYYDSSSSQGVDWTEDDTDSNWEHIGYVAVCTSTGASCTKYW